MTKIGNPRVYHHYFTRPSKTNDYINIVKGEKSAFAKN